MPQHRANCRIMIGGSLALNWSDYVGDRLVHVQVAEGAAGSTTLMNHLIGLAAFLRTFYLLIDLNFPVMAFEYQQADPIAVAAEPAVAYAQRECRSIP